MSDSTQYNRLIAVHGEWLMIQGYFMVHSEEFIVHGYGIQERL